MNWEYEVLEIAEGNLFSGKIKAEELKTQLNELGAEGWELVSVASNKDSGMGNSIAVLKRPVKD